MTADGFDVLYENGPCLVVNKPAGVLTQAPPGIDSMEVRIKAFLQARTGRVEPVYLGIPHRLDRPASGAMVFCTTRRDTQRVAQQFEGRLVQKTYWALVEGHLDAAQGTWTDSIRKVHGEARSEIVAPGDRGGRTAVLHYRVIGRHAAGDWLSIELETGRTHQVRVQAGSRRHAILGDELYGATTPFGPPIDDTRLRPIALHARNLSFRHPRTRELISIEAPLSDPWPSLESMRCAAEREPP